MLWAAFGASMTAAYDLFDACVCDAPLATLQLTVNSTENQADEREREKTETFFMSHCRLIGQVRAVDILGKEKSLRVLENKSREERENESSACGILPALVHLEFFLNE